MAGLKSYHDKASNKFVHELPSDLQAQATALNIDWNAVIKAMEQFGVPLVVGVVNALATSNWLALFALIGQYGWPLVQAIIAALGIAGVS